MKYFFYNDFCLPQLVVFLRAVWSKTLTESIFLERRDKDLSENPYGRCAGFPIAVAMKDNKVIGHHAATPVKIWMCGKEVLSYWLSGLHVLKEERGKGVAKNLQETTNQLSMATSFWVIEATLRVKKRLGWTIVGKIPEYVKILDPQMVVNSLNYNELPKMRFRVDKVIKLICFGQNRLASSFFVVSIKAINFCTQKIFHRHSVINSQIKMIDNFDAGIDLLWDKNKKHIKYAQVRNSAYMNWKFKCGQGWIKIVAKKNNITVGYAILSLKSFEKQKYLTYLRTLSIIDIFWDFEQPDVYGDLLLYIERLGLEKKASILISSINNKAGQKTLLSNGYCRIPGTVYFGFHSTNYKCELSSDLKDWFITRGDGDAAGSLGAT